MSGLDGRISKLEKLFGLDRPYVEVPRPKVNRKRRFGNLLVGLLSLANLYGWRADNKVGIVEDLGKLTWGKTPSDETIGVLADLLCELLAKTEEEKQSWFDENFPSCFFAGNSKVFVEGATGGGWNPRLALKKRKGPSGKKKGAKGAGKKKSKMKSKKMKAMKGHNGKGKLPWAK